MGDELDADLIDESVRITLDELCERCGLPQDEMVEMISYGVVEPIEGRDRRYWRFRAVAVRRVLKARRLHQDLGVNLPGASLALDLLEEVERLRSQLRRIR